jgi:1-acyl-sn-glycerol-3-phosphate acyltransferase
MLVRIPLILRVPLIWLLIASHTVVLVTSLLLCSLFKGLLPFKPVQRVLDVWILALAESWIACNSAMMDHLTSLQVGYSENTALDAEGHYLVISNHQSWVDILVLQKVFNKRIPFMRFFLKKELFWVPFLGLAWWALDFPFMQRHTKSQLQKRPELAGQDIVATRKACEKFLGKPVSIMIFPEGTRFTPAKHAQQQSPFKGLLKPKSGGMAYALDAMGRGLHYILDVTLIYPNGRPSIADLVADRIKKVMVDVRVLEIPESLRIGDYENNRAFRVEFQAWMNGLWLEKQNRLNSSMSR